MTLGPSEWFSDQYPGCSFDATYNWSGLKTRGANLAVKLYDGSGAVIATTPQVQNVPSSGSFTFIFTWKGGGVGPTRSIHARGVLLSSGVEIAGTAVITPSTSESCNAPLSVGWVSTIPLT